MSWVRMRQNVGHRADSAWYLLTWKLVLQGSNEAFKAEIDAEPLQDMMTLARF